MENLFVKLLASKCYLLELDESTNIANTAHLVIFIRRTFGDLFEELLALSPLKGTMRGAVILETIFQVLLILLLSQAQLGLHPP